MKQIIKIIVFHMVNNSELITVISNLDTFLFKKVVASSNLLLIVGSSMIQIIHRIKASSVIINTSRCVYV